MRNLLIETMQQFGETGRWDQDLTAVRLLTCLSDSKRGGFRFPTLTLSHVSSAKGYTWAARRSFAQFWLGERDVNPDEGGEWKTGFDHYNNVFIGITVANKYGLTLQPTETASASGSAGEIAKSRLVGSRRFLLDMACAANSQMRWPMFITHTEMAWHNGAVYAGLIQGEMEKMVTPTSNGAEVLPTSIHPKFMGDLVEEIRFLSSLHEIT